VFVHGVPFETQPNDNEMNSETSSVMGSPILPPPPSHRNQHHLVARPLLVPPCSEAVQVRTWFIYEQNMCTIWNIPSHRNRLLPFMKHLGMRKVHKVTVRNREGKETTLEMLVAL
jgi:hypothetical protein